MNIRRLSHDTLPPTNVRIPCHCGAVTTHLANGGFFCCKCFEQHFDVPCSHTLNRV